MANKSISKHIQNSIIIYSASGIFIIGVIIAFVSITPLFNHLKNGANKNLLSTAKIKALTVDEFLSRVKDISLQIASRTRIRDYLDEYNQGKISLNGLTDFSKSKLMDAMKSTKDVRGITRLDKKGNPVIQVGLPIPAKFCYPPAKESRDVIIQCPINLKNKSYLVSSAHIFDRKLNQIGTDIILFGITRLQKIVKDTTGLGKTGESVLGAVCKEGVRIFFPLRGREERSSENISRDSALIWAFQKALHKKTGILRSSKNRNIIAYTPIHNSKWAMVVKMDEKELYAIIHHQFVVILGIIVILISIGTLGMFFLVRPLTGKMVIRTDELQKEIQKKTLDLQTELRERKRTEENLRKARNELEKLVKLRTGELKETQSIIKSLIKYAPFSVWVCNEEGTVTFVNQSALEMFGVTNPSQIIGHYNIYRSTTEAEKTFLKYFERAWAGEVVRYRQRLNMKTVKYNTSRRGTMHIHSTLFAIPSAGKRRSNIVVIQEDITERVQAEQGLKKARDELELKVTERTKELAQANLQLKDLDRLKSMFIASMSHELRTPLNSIIGFTGIILQGMAGEITGEQRKQLTMVKNSARHLLALINDIIDVSKIEAGKIEVAFEEFDISNLLQEVKDSFELFAKDKGLNLILKMPKNLLIVSDKRRVKQVIINLVSNAVKFTDKGEIEIKAARKDGMIEISVRDTGIGIRKEDQDKLFKPFSQIYIKNRTKQEGTGLGLYLSKKIVELLGGNIRVESEFEKGSTFIFTLPQKHKG